MNAILDADCTGKYTILNNLQIPENIQQSWQKTIDLMAQAMGVPAGLIMRVHQKQIEVCIASSNSDNVYEPNELADLHTGLYCETVMSSNDTLLVPNALTDPVWANNPDVKLNMISYLGMPLRWPNSEVFGTICVLDGKENHYNDQYKELLREFQQSVQLSLKTIYENQLLINAQDELIKSKEKAEAACKAKSVFLANMSHELRTPLNAILGFSKMLQEESGLSDNSLDDLQAIRFSGEHLLRLINDVLDMSKIEAGRMDYDESEVELLQTIKDVGQLIRPKAVEKELSYTVDISPNVPQFVRSDLIKIRQILINLLSNAVKYTESGGVIMKVWSEPVLSTEDQGFQKLYFEVKDSGLGMTPEQAQEIFKPFEQISGRAIEGTGLGLAITSKFVGLMGGEIQVHSEPNKGSTFTVSFSSQVVLANDSEKLNREQRRVASLKNSQKTIRVLIAEDQKHNRNLLKKLLGRVGFDVLTVNNGAQAIAAVPSYQPDFIWLDIRMPEVNGIDACQRILSNASAKVPVVAAITTSIAPGEDQKALDAGCKVVLLKPYQEDEIFATMADYLNIEYNYVDELDQCETGLPNLDLSELVLMLDRQLLMELQQALESLDSENINRIINSIPAENSETANELMELAKAFEFERLIELVETALCD
ncbi:ATP-binding protein [uncultured Pseudoteredinibacter sp.]|uniref:hybrid sensor histidine kinase/response regulator n=1 Tax=uncultured Pseudoteredinibacter sp. TaxID=1641701 RepID=UPI00262EB53F|nr:ATP-binding protein [uncultured Pseudoteredinibacter sp.]